MSPDNNQTGELVDTGSLKINVSNLMENFPVSDALVQISRTDTAAVIDELTTNASGQTPEIDLKTPPLDYSLDPSGGKPYSEYTLNVIANGFQPVIVEGVQLLPASTALQNINMLQTGNIPVESPRSYLIGPHTLWGIFPPKIPESEVKELPFPSGLVVLPQPVVPEFVVVHLGAPTDNSAQNVWVAFKDYIKNVASCEIYSTWPVQSLRANILAIISFTLNRVFSEWYRGKGFNFTITNSTAFDQSFMNGRNFYEDISTVVDDIFTTYVTRPNIFQPLLTQYCDGVRTQCVGRGMEQWGSKDLGDQGFDALSILRIYYGSDVYLTNAEKVEGVPISYPGYTLQVGSTGEPVRTIQQQLNAISNNYPAIAKQRVDGVYGENTADVVRIFQEVFNLPVTGVVDFATWYAISNIYVAVTGIAGPIL